MHFHGTEVGKPIPSYQIYKGTVFELVDQAVDFVMSKITRAVGTRALGPQQAPVEYELPHEAVAEAIVNAITHRDYTSNASVQVMLFADRLEVWNPGELPPPFTSPSSACAARFHSPQSAHRRPDVPGPLRRKSRQRHPRHVQTVRPSQSSAAASSGSLAGNSSRPSIVIG